MFERLGKPRSFRALCAKFSLATSGVSRIFDMTVCRRNMSVTVAVGRAPGGTRVSIGDGVAGHGRALAGPRWATAWLTTVARWWDKDKDRTRTTRELCQGREQVSRIGDNAGLDERNKPALCCHCCARQGSRA